MIEESLSLVRALVQLLAIIPTYEAIIGLIICPLLERLSERGERIYDDTLNHVGDDEYDEYVDSIIEQESLVVIGCELMRCAIVGVTDEGRELFGCSSWKLRHESIFHREGAHDMSTNGARILERPIECHHQAMPGHITLSWNSC